MIVGTEATDTGIHMKYPRRSLTYLSRVGNAALVGCLCELSEQVTFRLGPRVGRRVPASFVAPRCVVVSDHEDGRSAQPDFRAFRLNMGVGVHSHTNSQQVSCRIALCEASGWSVKM